MDATKLKCCFNRLKVTQNRCIFYIGRNVFDYLKKSNYMKSINLRSNNVLMPC